jgi:hypothetical protein
MTSSLVVSAQWYSYCCRLCEKTSTQKCSLCGFMPIQHNVASIMCRHFKKWNACRDERFDFQNACVTLLNFFYHDTRWVPGWCHGKYKIDASHFTCNTLKPTISLALAYTLMPYHLYVHSLELCVAMTMWVGIQFCENAPMQGKPLSSCFTNSVSNGPPQSLHYTNF